MILFLSLQSNKKDIYIFFSLSLSLPTFLYQSIFSYFILHLHLSLFPFLSISEKIIIFFVKLMPRVIEMFVKLYKRLLVTDVFTKGVVVVESTIVRPVA